MNKSFWENKKVLLTGHTGFKGSWASLILSNLGANVRGLSLEPPTRPSMFVAVGIEDVVSSVIGDIRNSDVVTRTMSDFGPQIVIHMAAQSLVRRSFSHPAETFETNVMGTLNVLEAVRSSPSVELVLIITTDKCYENEGWVWAYRESDKLGGADPYSSSKACAELITGAYRRTFFNNSGGNSPRISTVRAGNVIGGGDWAEDRLIPDLIRAFFTNSKVQIRNAGHIRPWQHVLEPLSGYFRLIERMSISEKYCGAWNFGPRLEDTMSVGWIVDKFSELLPMKVDFSFTDTDSEKESSVLRLDWAKSFQYLNWKPTWTLNTAIENTIEWYAQYYAQPQPAPDKLRLLSLEQYYKYAL